ncbi:Error-prone DNA polymerase [Novipirellula aureliae]|uniref:Error-prone DNA polymerase n=1 Tax=Novipirellula aureliae TaxID=2527966 RepID=A0A5C6DVC3_9BACT|nr:error-prone DNA polymerase [Novipirellula aureliae]TWU41323.1 Error-prone DNA polymerase [Novipirellula aureliae]
MKYVELHCKSNFSFLQGASHPDELVERASELGYAGLSITDEASFAGIVRGHTPAKEVGIEYLVGTEIDPIDGPPLVLWPTDRAAYGRLCRLISRGRMRAEKGRYRLSFADIAEHSEGSIAAVLPTSDCTVHFLQRQFGEVFADRAYVLLEMHRGVDDREKANRLREVSMQTGVPLVAAGGVHYHCAERMLLHDCVTAIRSGMTIEEVSQRRFTNSQFGLRTLAEIADLFRDAPDAIARTAEIASRCNFSLDELRYEYPVELAPEGKTPIEHLKRLTWEGANQRWPTGVPERIIDLVRHEMKLIEELGYEAYFLTVWDLVRFARGRGILCQGRGSAANSAVCYCLGITSVDPSQTDLLFERFISRERNEAPDIDVDFEHQRREEVLQYLYEKYGRHRAGLTAVVTTYRTRSAIREVGKVLGISPDQLDALSKAGGGLDRDARFSDRCRAAGLNTESEIGKRFVYLVQSLIGFPRHLSQHTGGMVMTQGELCELCPIENAAMDGRTVIQWNKDDLDELGILKVDVLALGMLSAIRRCFELVARHHGRDLSLSTIPADDCETYDMICAADTIGVFQIESRAQMSMLPRLRPRCYYDLVVEVAIVRPGPIQGNMVHPFLKARQDPASVVYPNEAIRGVLEKTLGVPIFQEQAMRLAVVAAGFTPGEADQLRRAMAAWRRPGVIEKFRIKLLEGMRRTGLDEKFAEHVFHQIRGFGEYGFPESHAASFALLVYASCYLKRHFPAAFCVALLNSQPMGFYAPAQLVADAKKHGVVVFPLCVNRSDWQSTLEANPDNENQPAIRLGLDRAAGLAKEAAERIVAERNRGGAFANVAELVRRTKVSSAVVSKLADADAFQTIAGDRRAAVWQSLAQETKPTEQPLFGSLMDEEEPIPDGLASMSMQEEVEADYRTIGMSLKAHPISFLRPQLEANRCVRASDLPGLRDGRHVRVAGVVLLRQRPGTAKGITFVTIEDETGSMNLVFFPAVWKRFYAATHESNVWMIDGKLENREGVIHVVVGRVDKLENQSVSIDQRSRDFR